MGTLRHVDPDPPLPHPRCADGIPASWPDSLSAMDEADPSAAPSERTRVKRLPELATYERAAIEFWEGVVAAVDAEETVVARA